MDPESIEGKESKQKDAQNPEKVRFHFIKSASFRVIHADGAWGGLTPQGNIHMALYNERNPIPQLIAHKINPSGSLGKEIKEERIARNGLVREVEVDVIMNLPTARALDTWLQEKIKSAEEVIESQKEKK
jgi:hypothetical protein